MSERLNKTSICSIVFIDIVGYSQKPVAEQIEIKDRFNELISGALKDTAQSDRIILDTGDGVAIALLGAPEDALFISLTIRDGVVKDGEKYPSQPLSVRIGINLGPVRIVKDINGQPNIIGDGINVAQRVMSFAGINEILVSRSYYEVTSRLTQEFTEMFSYSGIKQDKHVREHEVYVVRSGHEKEFSDANIKRPESVPEQEETKRVGKVPQTKLIIGVGISVIVAIAIVAVMFGKHAPPAEKSEAEIFQPKNNNVVETPPEIPHEGAPQASSINPPINSAAKAESTGKEIVSGNASSQPAKKSVATKTTHQKTPSENNEDNASDSEETSYGAGYLTKDETGRQVILYGAMADEARARDKEKREKNK